jgi:hypothetical protein
VITEGNYNKDESALALKALGHSMLEKDRLALVRYVSRDNAPPKIGVLQPEFILGDENQPDTVLLHFYAVIVFRFLCVLLTFYD